jgi:RES domain-containing protein
LTFNAKQRAVIQRWMGRPVSLKGFYFRSVEYRYMDPTNVLSGAGTRAHRGRFAAVGIRAVYLSATESGASKEVTARKARFAGAAQISNDKYPRVV